MQHSTPVIRQDIVSLAFSTLWLIIFILQKKRALSEPEVHNPVYHTCSRHALCTRELYPTLIFGSACVSLSAATQFSQTRNLFFLQKPLPFMCHCPPKNSSELPCGIQKLPPDLIVVGLLTPRYGTTHGCKTKPQKLCRSLEIMPGISNLSPIRSCFTALELCVQQRQKKYLCS